MKKLLIISTLGLSLLLSGCFGSNESNVSSTNYPADAIVTTAPILAADSDNMIDTEGMYEVIENEDGTIQYVVSPELLEESRALYYDAVQYTIESTLAEDVSELSNITNIEMNDDLTEFNIYVDGEQPVVSNLYLASILLDYGTTYQLYLQRDLEIFANIFNSNGELVEALSSSYSIEQFEEIEQKYLSMELVEEETSDMDLETEDLEVTE